MEEYQDEVPTARVVYVVDWNDSAKLLGLGKRHRGVEAPEWIRRFCETIDDHRERNVGVSLGEMKMKEQRKIEDFD